jgi:hypothetical protein
VKTGHAPQNLAAFRNAAISLLRLAGFQEIAPPLRDFAYQPRKPLRFLDFMKNGSALENLLKYLTKGYLCDYDGFQTGNWRGALLI